MADPNDITAVTFAPALGIDLATFTRGPQGYYYKDIVVGQGNEARAGSQVGLHYLGRLPDGTQFDANQGGQPPLTFTIGAGRVVAGFEYGVTGMKAGGQRVVIIPSSLGYGARPYGPLPAFAVLVFTLDMVSVSAPGR